MIVFLLCDLCMLVEAQEAYASVNDLDLLVEAQDVHSLKEYS